MPQIYDMGPTASAGFESANLGTKGQHATPRPPKPYNLMKWLSNININILRDVDCQHELVPSILTTAGVVTT